ncbi:hypothetical protein B0H67DRAFT_592671 [Lasiosphaeris hirsuta]|uniref:Geranylgeranyl transferase type-2 subunit alpha n=1 Tax=Lasiosphaeris hirsuta TaxID=260670 RepID=A0AA39ZWI3_9PEZI|nr:hypothetical protein B0H67DRAFT_592671 [Lasiosphaeris hirsuta]
MADQGGSAHGIARASRVRTEEQRKVELDKIAKYRELEDQVRSSVARGDTGPDLFQLTSKLLRLNPEYYTVWNVRRRLLTSGLLSKPSAASSPLTASLTASPTATTTPPSAASSSSSLSATQPSHASPTAGRSGTTADSPVDEAKTSTADATPRAAAVVAVVAGQKKDFDILKSELEFTIPLLLDSPKCYWIWSYRLWLLQQVIDRLSVPVARRVWQEELGLASKMLTRDRRNFHAWGYRRHVVAQLESPRLGGGSMVEAEFEYTTRMIRMDLSNFSAWHSRSKLIPRLLGERGADDSTRKGFLDEELGLIREALNVGPEDQSLWYYHQFLILNLVNPVGHPTLTPAFTLEDRVTYVTREIQDIKELLEDYDDVKLIYEALLEYTLYLGQLQGRKLDGAEKDELAEWLQKLKKLDPMRNGRWTELERECGLVEMESFGN